MRTLPPPVFLIASAFLAVPAFGENVSVTDASGSVVASGDTLNSVSASLGGNTATLSGNITETERIKFTTEQEISIQSDSSTVRQITSSIPRTTSAVQNAIFLTTGDSSNLTLNLSNVKLTNTTGYVAGGINVTIVGDNAIFDGCQNPNDTSAYVGQGGVIRTTTKTNNTAPKNYGVVTISGTNTFTNNSAWYGGAIYAAREVIFSGTGSKAVFRGNTMDGKDGSAEAFAGANDIWTGGATGYGVTFQDAGEYIFDGGIRLARTTSGKLVAKTGAKVTFEGGAINLIKNTTTLSGTGTIVIFENASGSNTLGRDISVKEGSTLRIAEGAQITMGTTSKEVKLAVEAGAVLEIGLCDAYADEDGIAAIVGVADATSNTLSVTDAITLDAADAYAFGLVMKNTKLASFKIFDAETVDSALTIENFLLSENWSGWEVSDYANGVVTLAYIPEPSAFGFLAGAFALALAVRRRNRRGFAD